MPLLNRTAGVSIHYEINDFTDPWADRPYLLLQHGNGRSARFWYRWIPYLSRHYKVIRPDMRGLGRSTGRLDLAQDITLDALVGWTISARPTCIIAASRWAAFSALPSPRATRTGCGP